MFRAKTVASLQPDISESRELLFRRFTSSTGHNSCWGLFGERSFTRVTLLLNSYCVRRRGSIRRLDGLSRELFAVLACLLVVLPQLGCGTTVNSSAATDTTGQAALSGLTCSSASMAGSGSDHCTVTLTAAVGSGGLNVSLTSSSAAVTVPATLLVPANAMSAGFNASVSSVPSAQTVTLTASAGSVSKTFALQLSAASASSSSQLTISTASLAFGNVTVNTSSTLPVTLTSSGTSPVTINSGTLTGPGYTMSGATFPVTLNQGLAVTLEVVFDPTAVGAAVGQLTIQSNSSTNATAVISLSGTGESASTTGHEVDLSWDAPSSSADPVVGYNVYRSTGAGSSAFQVINSSADTQTTYVDNTVQSGSTYEYMVESVDASGVESVPSNQISATIP